MRLFNVICRELDFDVFNILKVGLISKATLDTNLNTEVILALYVELEMMSNLM